MLSIKKHNFKLFLILFFSVFTFFSCKDKVNLENDFQKISEVKISENLENKIQAFYEINYNVQARAAYDSKNLSKLQFIEKFKISNDFEKLSLKEQIPIIKILLSFNNDSEVEIFLNYYTKLKNEIDLELKAKNYSISSKKNLFKKIENNISKPISRNAKINTTGYEWLYSYDQDFVSCRSQFNQCVSGVVSSAFFNDALGGALVGAGIAAIGTAGTGVAIGAALGFYGGTIKGTWTIIYSYNWGGCATGLKSCVQAAQLRKTGSSYGCDFPVFPPPTSTGTTNPANN